MAFPLAQTVQNIAQVLAPKRDKREYKPRLNGGGNYCGHDPEKPRFISVINPYRQDKEQWTPDSRDSFGHKRKSSIFYKASDALQLLYYAPKTLKALGYHLMSEERAKERKRRSERRESIISVLTAFIHHMEMASVNWEGGFVRVGRPSVDNFTYFDLKFWVKKTGLSLSQIKRALFDLEAAGYIGRKRMWVERERGQFKALVSQTVIYLELFSELNLIDELKEASKKSYDALQRRAAELNVSTSRMLRCAVFKGKKEAEREARTLKAIKAQPVIDDASVANARSLKDVLALLEADDTPVKTAQTAIKADSKAAQYDVNLDTFAQLLRPHEVPKLYEAFNTLKDKYPAKTENELAELAFNAVY